MLAAGQIKNGQLVSFSGDIMHVKIDQHVYDALLKEEKYELLSLMRKGSSGLLVGKKIVIHSPHHNPETHSKLVDFFQRCGAVLESACE